MLARAPPTHDHRSAIEWLHKPILAHPGPRSQSAVAASSSLASAKGPASHFLARHPSTSIIDSAPLAHSSQESVRRRRVTTGLAGSHQADPRQGLLSRTILSQAGTTTAQGPPTPSPSERLTTICMQREPIAERASPRLFCMSRQPAECHETAHRRPVRGHGRRE